MLVATSKTVQYRQDLTQLDKHESFVVRLALIKLAQDNGFGVTAQEKETARRIATEMCDSVAKVFLS